jgi:hypothetical protein
MGPSSPLQGRIFVDLANFLLLGRIQRRLFTLLWVRRPFQGKMTVSHAPPLKHHHTLLPETVVTCHHALLPETVGVMASQGMMALQRHSLAVVSTPLYLAAPTSVTDATYSEKCLALLSSSK